MQPQGSRVVGVGLGPGDPDLVTVAALRLLEEADVVLVPRSEREGVGRAERIVAHLVPTARVVPFTVPMRVGLVERRRIVAEGLRALAPLLETGGLVVVATVGDPSTYASWGLVCHVLAEEGVAPTRVVAGVTAYQAAAARAGVELVDADESLVVVPATAGRARVAQALADPEATVVVYKVGRHLPWVREAVVELGRGPDAVIAIDLGGPDEQLVALDEAPTSPGYFSLVLVPARRRS